MDLQATPALRIPEAELHWRFSRSSGPGGQHVNTSDSRVELSWDVLGSEVVDGEQKAQLAARLGRRLVAGVLTVSASQERSQLRNREIALAKMGELIAAGLAPGPRKRLPTKPTQGSKRRHLLAKTRRSETKALRQRPPSD